MTPEVKPGHDPVHHAPRNDFLAYSDLIHGRRSMILDLSALNPDILFELSGCRGKGIPQRHVHVFMRLPVVMIAADHDVLVRHVDIDSDLVKVTLMLVMMFRFDRNPATDDVLAVLFEFCGLLTNSRLDGVGMRNTPKRDLKW